LSKSRHSRHPSLAVAWVVEFAFLMMLWILFTTSTKTSEVLIGLPAAALAAFADGVIKSHESTRFRPRWSWVLLIFWEPWYLLTGTAQILAALARQMLGHRPEAQFKLVRFNPGGDDEESHARRALATLYMTIPPNFVVIGIDRVKRYMLVHQVLPTPTPEIAKRLGAEA